MERVDASQIIYIVCRFEPTKIDLTPVNSGFDVVFECQEEASAFDGLTRSCPTLIGE
ncbi:MAG: hypothetical protein AAF125_22785 [Chloroflexota bacterium]